MKTRTTVPPDARRAPAATAVASSARSGRRAHAGFTLIELMVVVVVVGILATLGAAAWGSVKARSIDATMKSDLRHAMAALEDYRIQNDGDLPPDATAFENATGFHLSPGVTWEKFDLKNKNGVPSIHMHVQHPASPHRWHANYPAEGGAIERR